MHLILNACTNLKDMNQDRNELNELISSAIPFIRIVAAKQESWCRVMKNEKDPRIGPWNFVASFDVLSQETWNREGEVIYFVTDNQGMLRLVGQSISRLKGRWKTVPMYSIFSKQSFNKNALFHSSSWPAIENGLRSNEHPPFTVSALFRPELERICRSSQGSLQRCLSIPETHLQRLSFHVETWVCELDHQPMPLWNKDKVPHQFSTI